MHDLRKKTVNEIQQGFATAEIFDQWQGAPGSFSPGFQVAAKNVGICLAKAVDTLLDVTNEKSISRSPMAAQRLQDLVLSSVDVLILVDKNKFEFLLPFFGEQRWCVRPIVPKEP